MGMHIPVMVRVDERGPFRNQSGLLSAKRKYYLVDNKYANMPGFIAPYQGVPYRTNQIPSGYHRRDAKSYLINGIHHYGLPLIVFFGALKGQFTILLSAPPCPLQTQVKLVVVACALHNYTRREKPDDWLFRMYEQDTLLPMAESLHPLQAEQPMLQANTRALQFCFQTEQLELACTEMYDDYISGLASV
ncbi:DDE Tnp4 domain-containing protein [Citrus sinensis]|uniref:DDE Tnp4 domain-containing protein n=1 Tax=Citrus sinensis TaxID=2711 RepID=A0ACB8IGX3_CITSI|nr:DDE Tnp4 domain-containing protein [Citrus sinensis]